MSRKKNIIFDPLIETEIGNAGMQPTRDRLIHGRPTSLLQLDSSKPVGAFLFLERGIRKVQISKDHLPGKVTCKLVDKSPP